MTDANYKLKCGHMVADEMAAFDGLAKEIREAVSASPFGTCAVDVKEHCGMWGDADFLKQLRHAEKQLAA